VEHGRGERPGINRKLGRLAAKDGHLDGLSLTNRQLVDQ
jgi:hypothetical protein